jgi:SET domain-containing protein
MNYSLEKPEKLEVNYSPIQGRGVFASKKINKGEVLEECHFFSLGIDNFDELIDSVKPFVFAWPKGGKDSAFVTGFASIYNHSHEPNADWETDTIKEVFRFFSLKNIEIGEEIFIKYGNYEFS